MTTLSIVVCTRDRPSELERCIASVRESFLKADRVALQVVVVDDGKIADDLRRTLDTRLTALGIDFLYIPRSNPEGLYPSRLEGIRRSYGEIVLFLDDDVVMDKAYLAGLVRLYQAFPDIVGIGGVDELDPPRSAALRALHRVFLFDSGHPGRLSASGFAGSFRRWREQRSAFTAEYLHGCNMAFRRPAIAELSDVDWLRGFSQADDLYMSLVARKHGRLLVSPELRVWHHRPSGPTASRPANPAAVRADIVNMFRLLRLEHYSPLRVLGFFWTVSCFMLRDLIRPDRAPLLAGYVQGARDVLRLLRVRSEQRTP